MSDMYLCRNCHTNKPATEFYIEHSKTRCKGCTRAKITEHVTRINDESRDNAEHHRERWTEDEVAFLLEGMAERISYQELAECLGRTYLATMNKGSAIRRALEPGIGVATRSTGRNSDYVGSAPDEDRWWEAAYYKETPTDV